MPFGGEPLSLERLGRVVDTARDSGFAALAANDHLVFRTRLARRPDGAGERDRALRAPGPRHDGDASRAARPVPLAKALAAIDCSRRGGSSRRWGRARRRATTTPWASPSRSVGSDSMRRSPCCERCSEADRLRRIARFYVVPSDLELAPGPRQRGGGGLWVASWGSHAGLARVARRATVGSRPRTTRHRSASRPLVAGWRARSRTGGATRTGSRTGSRRCGRGSPTIAPAGERILVDVLAPLLHRDPDELRAQVCVGPVDHCAELLSRYAEAGCRRVYLWPLGDEQRQLELVAGKVAPMIGATGRR